MELTLPGAQPVPAALRQAILNACADDALVDRLVIRSGTRRVDGLPTPIDRADRSGQRWLARGMVAAGVSALLLLVALLLLGRS